MSRSNILRPLPFGVTVKDDPCIGVSYYLDGSVILQHPEDNDAARAMVYQIWKNKRGLYTPCIYCGFEQVDMVGCPNFECPGKVKHED